MASERPWCTTGAALSAPGEPDTERRRCVVMAARDDTASGSDARQLSTQDAHSPQPASQPFGPRADPRGRPGELHEIGGFEAANCSVAAGLAATRLHLRPSPLTPTASSPPPSAASPTILCPALHCERRPARRPLPLRPTETGLLLAARCCPRLQHPTQSKPPRPVPSPSPTPPPRRRPSRLRCRCR